METSDIKELELLKEVNEQTALLIYEYNCITGELTWFGNAEISTGFTLQELRKFDITMWLDRIHKDDLTVIHNQEKVYTGNKRPFTLYYRFLNKGGEYINLKDNGVAFANNELKEIREIGRIEIHYNNLISE